MCLPTMGHVDSSQNDANLKLVLFCSRKFSFNMDELKICFWLPAWTRRQQSHLSKRSIIEILPYLTGGPSLFLKIMRNVFVSGSVGGLGVSLMHGTTCESLCKHPKFPIPRLNNVKWSPWLPTVERTTKEMQLNLVRSFRDCQQWPFVTTQTWLLDLLCA